MTFKNTINNKNMIHTCHKMSINKQFMYTLGQFSPFCCKHADIRTTQVISEGD